MEGRRRLVSWRGMNDGLYHDMELDRFYYYHALQEGNRPFC